MTIALVQSVTVTDAASGSFSAPTTAGNTVIVVVTCAQTGNVTMAVTGATLGGSAGNFAQAASSQSGYAGGFTEFAAIWGDPVCAGGQTAVAVSGTNLPLGAGSDNGFTAYEVAGLVSSASLASVLDKSATNSGTTGTAVSSGTTAATAQAAEIAFAGLAGADVLSSPTAGYTVAPINDGSGEFNAAAYRVLSATGTQAFAATQASSLPWAGAIATFKAATSASHTATASLTVTPSLSATRAHVQPRTASLTVTPSFSAHATGGEIPSNAILDEAGDPILDEADGYILDESSGTTSHTPSASLTVTPSFSAETSAAHVATASLTVTPVLSAAGNEGVPHFTATASLTVQPSFSAAALHGHHPSASLTITPSLSAAAVRARFRTASLTVTPVLSAAPSAAHVAHASLTVTPVLSATRVHADVRTAGLTVRPVLTAGAAHGTGSPPGYPDGDLGAMVELLLGGTWTDLTTEALPAGQQYGSIKGGQPDGAQQPSPATLNGTWDNPDYSLSSRNADGPYYGQLRQNTPARLSFNSPYGAYLRLEADNHDMASVADTSALHVTGSLELRIGVRLSDWRPCTLAARNDGTTASWSLILNVDGTLSFFWFDSGGTLRHVTSPAAAGVSWTAFRATLDATNGNVQFYLSDTIDGSWTSMGAAASGTSGAATSVRAGNCPLITGWSAAGGTQMRGQVYALRLYSGIGGTVVADAEFSSQLPGVTSWTDGAGRAWSLSGGAELTGRDYRLYGEVASLAPTADVSSSLPRVQAQLAGRMRRLQQGSAPTVDSAMKRAILSQTGLLYPVDYWPMEETQAAKTFGPSVGSQLLTASLGKVQAAADSSLDASGPLPLLGGDTLTATVDTYSGATAWAVRFVFKEGTTLPASGTARLIEVTTTGACTTLRVSINPDGSFNFIGLLSGGSTAFSFTEVAYPQIPGPAWWSVEATTSGSGVLYALVALSPGGITANTEPSTVTGHGGFGVVTSIHVNQDLILTDSMFGHLSVQKAWTSMNTLGPPLNAWRTELTADRFARICAEQGIPCRIIGRPQTTQAMGPQPRGSVWTILRDCANTEQGLIFEPRDVFGLGLRTRESMGIQQAGVTLSFADANLRGDLQPADDDQGFLNDVTGAMSDGTSWREVLDDGSANSIAEPKDGGRGRYAGSIPFTVNVADPSELSGNVAFYLGRTSVDEARYRNVALDLGVDGAPAAAIAHLRPGDKVVITDVPGIYQTADIEQLASGWTETFGPGRVITLDCLPASPYDT